MIKIDHLTKEYQDFSLNISLEVPEGRVTGLVGRNGAGKSTTIKAILGLIDTDGGSVTVLGKPADQLKTQDRQRMGVALAEGGFSSYLTLRSVTAILKRLYTNFDEAWFLRQAKEQQLPMNKCIKDFSTGMRAKLRVLTAMSHGADLMILDEPTAGLDVLARNEILDLLRQYISEDEKRSVLITSHISSDLEGLCDDIYLIHDGKVLFHEDTHVLLGEYAILKVSSAEYETLDQRYLLKTRKTSYGYDCLTDQRQYYLENYPQLVVEKANLDEVIVVMASN